MAEESSKNGEWRTAIFCLRQASEIDRASETTHRALMHSLITNGDYEEAIRIFKELTRHLQRTLGRHPDPETIDLYELAKRELTDATDLCARLMGHPDSRIRFGIAGLARLFPGE